MTAATGHPPRRGRRPAAPRRAGFGRAGFGLAEAMLAVFVVGLVLVGAMAATAAAKTTETRAAHQAQGAALAHGLLAEILSLDYQESSGTPVFGQESGETTRADFDDVDDYHGLAESPPKNRDGTVIPDLAGWARAVMVEWVSPDGLAGAAQAAEGGMKRVTVTVTRKGIPVATAVGFANKN